MSIARLHRRDTGREERSAIF